ncbi:hypothetical protein SAMN05443287_103485 [Micromonospora phaseoli]|uniref:Uncharacterized protein n=1 Tax=Micromonospora phaseoli TaxID=1144548 RepID=A0A1H6X618_9ACTN|nr:hypothetical protein CLV64_102483 [Micromonospora phaseoli]SEJ24603.1 hypothetical protein SAMN05443287_103485 [Micromonospora phaseoli]
MHNNMHDVMRLRDAAQPAKLPQRAAAHPVREAARPQGRR